jgi:hypothetical protein
MLVDVPTMFFLALSVFTFLKALDHGGARWTGCASLALLLAAFSKYSAWMLLTVLPVIFFVRQRKAKGTTFRRALAVALLSGGLIGAVVAIKFGVFAEQARLLMNYQQPGLERWGESFFSTFFFHVHPFITLAAVASLGIAWRRRDWNYAVICWLVLLVLLFGIRRSRYILPALPMLALMAHAPEDRTEGREKVHRIPDRDDLACDGRLCVPPLCAQYERLEPEGRRSVPELPGDRGC